MQNIFFWGKGEYDPDISFWDSSVKFNTLLQYCFDGLLTLVPSFANLINVEKDTGVSVSTTEFLWKQESIVFQFQTI